MVPLLSAEQFLSRVPQAAVLPLDDTGEADTARIETALRDATGIIAANLPWLLDTDSGEIALPVRAQFAGALNSICADIALYRDNMSLLNKINREYQGGLEGPGLQASAVVTPNENEGIEDGRFFKKGGMY